MSLSSAQNPNAIYDNYVVSCYGVARDLCRCILYLTDDFLAKNGVSYRTLSDRFHQVLLSVVVLSEGHGRETPAKILLVLASSGNVKDSDSVGCH
jgi:hypothetical protein